MADSAYNNVYNPDVLSCLANLSNDEVFTPPNVANAMLDMLPQELFRNPDTKFLDPACKSGVFLREIAKRLLVGLRDQIPNRQERINHIFSKQLFAVAITELTSLLARRSVYCSKYANSPYSVVPFNNVEGNIRYRKIQHTWVIDSNSRHYCKYCGVSQSSELGAAERGVTLESHAYEFIHTLNPQEIFNMKFDVVISNPPYQLNDGGGLGASASPIYNLFVEQAKKLNPHFVSMIIPSRWFSGGKGLDDFRKSMIEDKRISNLDDFLNASDCFGTGVEIKGGVCYFLWNRDYNGTCSINTHSGNEIISSAQRYLKIEGNDTFVRRNEAISILNKVLRKREKSFADIVSTRKPFGLSTNIKTHNQKKSGDIPIYVRGGINFIPKDTVKNYITQLECYKIFISKAYNGGDNYPHQIINKPLVANPGTCCSETYILIGPFSDKQTAENVATYMQTKFMRFLVSLKKISQNAARGVYQFVPMQDFSKPWTDEELYAKYKITKEEQAFIDSMIRPMDMENEEDAD